MAVTTGGFALVNWRSDPNAGLVFEVAPKASVGLLVRF